MSVFVLLGCRVRADGSPSPALQRRVAALVAAHKGAPERSVILSGKGTGPLTEAEVAARLCRNAGLDSALLILEAEARNTVENILNAHTLARDLGYGELYLVTDRLHLPRALIAAKTLGVPARAASGLPWPRPRSIPRLLVTECAAVPLAIARGVAARGMSARR